jgi:hypothetical protein
MILPISVFSLQHFFFETVLTLHNNKITILLCTLGFLSLVGFLFFVGEI